MAINSEDKIINRLKALEQPWYASIINRIKFSIGIALLMVCIGVIVKYFCMSSFLLNICCGEWCKMGSMTNSQNNLYNVSLVRKDDTNRLEGYMRYSKSCETLHEIEDVQHELRKIIEQNEHIIEEDNDKKSNEGHGGLMKRSELNQVIETEGDMETKEGELEPEVEVCHPENGKCGVKGE